MVCPECFLVWCFPCQAPWHEAVTCKEFRRGDKLLLRWAQQHVHGQANAQKCPKCKVTRDAHGCITEGACVLHWYEGDPNADGAMTMLYHLYVGGVNSAICGHRIGSTRPNF